MWPWSSAGAHAGGLDHTGLLDDSAWRKRWTPEAWQDALRDGLANAAMQERIRAATRTGRPAAGPEFVRDL